MQPLPTVAGEVSDWAVAEVLTWSRHLSRKEVLAVEAYLFARLHKPGREADQAVAALDTQWHHRRLL